MCARADCGSSAVSSTGEVSCGWVSYIGLDYSFGEYLAQLCGVC
jgi:hypothetical protein